MTLRRNILPKSRGEMMSTLANMISCPLNYYVFNFVVLPRYYKMWSFEYNIHFIIIIITTFMMYANMIAMIFCDTSVKGRIPSGTVVKDWKYCEKCEISAPPRSWHCNICDVCILKRDHHCFFTSCCIGFHNHRYFFMYLFTVAFDAFYMSYFNFYYFWEKATFEYTWTSLLKLLFPFISVFFMEWSSIHFHFIIIIETFCFGLMAGFLFLWCGYLISRNMVLFDKKRAIIYERGFLENIKVVFGERWYFVWLGPWVKSRLPCDGMNWEKYM